jgi:hypothetical protein
MKTLFLFTLTIILSINLNARENPFAVTDAYEDQRNARKDVKGKKPKSRCK